MSVSSFRFSVDGPTTHRVFAGPSQNPALHPRGGLFAVRRLQRREEEKLCFHSPVQEWLAEITENLRGFFLSEEFCPG